MNFNKLQPVGETYNPCDIFVCKLTGGRSLKMSVQARLTVDGKYNGELRDQRRALAAGVASLRAEPYQ